MRILSKLYSTVLLALLLASSPVAGKQISEYHQDAWDGGAYSSDQTGAFSHCAAAAGYNSGLLLVVSVGRDFNWAIGISNPDWRLAQGSRHDLSLRIDGGPWLDAPGAADSSQLIEIPMASDSTLITLFRKGHLLEVGGEGFRGQFDLTGTSRLIAALASCVQGQLTAEGAVSPPSESDPAEAPVTTAANSGTDAGTGREAHPLVTGTGIIVTHDGDVLTNNHVIDGCSDIVVRTENASAKTAELLFTDTANDLALLKIAGEFAPRQIASIRVSPAIRAGDPIAVYGYPLAGTLSVSGNIVQGNVSALAGLGDDARYFQITAPIQAGNSGGPLLDMGGNVAGIVNSKLDEMKMAAASGDLPQNVNFAIKGNVATNFLDAHGIAYNASATPTAASDLATVAEKARPFTALIVCQ